MMNNITYNILNENEKIIFENKSYEECIKLCINNPEYKLTIYSSNKRSTGKRDTYTNKQQHNFTSLQYYKPPVVGFPVLLSTLRPYLC